MTDTTEATTRANRRPEDEVDDERRDPERDDATQGEAKEQAQDRPAEPATDDTNPALFDPAAAKDFQGRWQTIQVAFVDEPKGAVEQADKLVEEVLSKLQASFSRERNELEHAWSGGDEASTEDLRQAIRRYRSFFNRLLSI